MPKLKKNIPVNSFSDGLGPGISLDTIHLEKSGVKTAEQQEEASRSHRDEGYTFHLVETGTVLMEIDFEQHRINAPAVVYMHPDQVHRILDVDNLAVCSLAMTAASLLESHLAVLEALAPARPLALNKEASANIFSAFSLCLHFFRQKDLPFYHLLVRDSCHALVAAIASALVEQNQLPVRPSRAEHITKSFRQLVETNYRTLKRPADYARKLHISPHYLNETVKQVTGASVSRYIQDRVVLEAKRLLHHTDNSVKEIASALGYDDYAYFSRLFSKTTGITPLAFRNKRHE